MRLILSRKGFDSQYGGMASPILPDGTLVPLPIPSSHDSYTLDDLYVPGIDISSLVFDLSRGRHSRRTTVHLDPDLTRKPGHWRPGWRPALGQTGIAQSHLRNEGIDVGDLFFFFGWFREVERRDGRWRYRVNAPDQHVLFGWLEIGGILPVVIDRGGSLEMFPWLVDHAHLLRPDHYSDPRNTVYVAAEHSRYLPDLPYGGGRFGKWHEVLRLTREGESRTVWSLPAWFYPTEGKPPLSYHGSLSRWRKASEGVVLHSVAKGQEFVLDCEFYPEAESWIDDIITKGSEA